MNDWPVRLILDTSAILEYCRESVDVGELLGEFITEQSTAALPVACLAQAYPMAVDQGRLDMLVAHEATAVYGDDGDDWRTLGAMCALTGDYAAASAAVAALDLGCWVLTTRPEWYESVKGGDLAVTIGD